MNLVCRFALPASFALAVSASAAAQPPAPQQPAPQQPAPQQQASGQQQPAQKPEEPQQPEQPPKFEETVVVSASRTEEKLINAPATMSVITGPIIETAPTQNFAELLRSVPGLNITQVSARDINVTSRGATGTLATGQLALLDGRSLYQDFFGFVMWDFLPVNLNEIKQVEVIRGPASAVWGANAVNGVVNVITKTPREMQGTSVIVGLGAFDRSVNGKEADSGSLVYFSGTHAQAVNERWAFKLSGGGYSQDALARPTGIIPGSPGAGTPYPAYRNTGTTQPKFDGRLDYDGADGRRLSFSGGFAGTEGIMHSGIGPFDINQGSTMAYGKVSFTLRGLRAAFFTNMLDGTADNLLTRDPQGRPIGFDFQTNTYDFEISNVQAFAARHVFNYGGNLRFNKFDLSLAPQGDDRTEFGIYAQDEIFLSDHFRWVIGARIDRFDFIDDLVFSPRTSFIIKPQEAHAIRLSYNRAYRSPSVINNFLNVTIAEPINLGLFSPLLAGRIYPLPVVSVGNPDLQETSLDAYEAAYTGAIGRTTLSLAFFVNRSKNDILFTELRDQRYTPLNPPPGWPLPPAVIGLVPGGSFPARFTYLNFGEVTQRGIEVGADTVVGRTVNVFANYSWQAEPDPEGFDISELNIPAKHRFNLGLGFNYRRFLGNLSVSYSDGAFWQDVLDDRFHGTTEPYTLINGGFGIRWGSRDEVTTSIKLMNLANEDVQQHVFGDIVKRQVVGEIRVQF